MHGYSSFWINYPTPAPTAGQRIARLAETPQTMLGTLFTAVLLLVFLALVLDLCMNWHAYGRKARAETALRAAGLLPALLPMMLFVAVILAA